MFLKIFYALNDSATSFLIKVRKVEKKYFSNMTGVKHDGSMYPYVSAINNDAHYHIIAIYASNNNSVINNGRVFHPYDNA